MKTGFFALFVFSAFLILNSCEKNDTPPVVPVATATPATQTIDSGSMTSIALTSTVSGASFTWTVVSDGVTGAVTGSGTSIAQTLTVSGTAKGTATYTITPTGNGVSGTPISVVVTVYSIMKTTFTADVKPILTTSCAPCHMPGGYQAKFDNYATVKSKISGILDRVQRSSTAAGFMPQNGTKLSDEKIAILKKWVTDGLVEN